MANQKEMKQEAILKVLAVLAQTYPRDVQKETMTAYSMFLDDVSIEGLVRAVKECVKESKFFPTVAELRERAGMKMESNLQPKNLALMAYHEQAMKAVTKVTSYGIPTFKDPITAKVIEMIGWKDFCMMDMDVGQRKFVELYNVVFQDMKAQNALGPHPEMQALQGMKAEIRGTGLWKCFNCYAFPIKAALEGDDEQECSVHKKKVHKFAEAGECEEFKHWDWNFNESQAALTAGEVK